MALERQRRLEVRNPRGGGAAAMADFMRPSFLKESTRSCYIPLFLSPDIFWASDVDHERVLRPDFLVRSLPWGGREDHRILQGEIFKSSALSSLTLLEEVSMGKFLMQFLSSREFLNLIKVLERLDNEPSALIIATWQLRRIYSFPSFEFLLP